MDIIDRVLTQVKELHSELIIGNVLNKDDTYRIYSRIFSEEEFVSKKYKHLLCGQITSLYNKMLGAHGICAKNIIVEFTPISNWDTLLVGLEYVKKAVSGVGYVEYLEDLRKRVVFDSGAALTFTHALSEIQVGEHSIIADATAGLVYFKNLATLMKGTGIEEALLLHGQHQFILDSPHTALPERPYSLFYITPLFWSNILSWRYQ